MGEKNCICSNKCTHRYCYSECISPTLFFLFICLWYTTIKSTSVQYTLILGYWGKSLVYEWRQLGYCSASFCGVIYANYITTRFYYIMETFVYRVIALTLQGKFFLFSYSFILYYFFLFCLFRQKNFNWCIA